MSRITLHSEASAEMNEAIQFYEDLSPGLGKALLDELRQAFAQIVSTPEAYMRIENRVRKKTLRRFPYTVLYAEQKDQIRVLAIAHQKRHPDYWKERQQDSQYY